VSIYVRQRCVVEPVRAGKIKPVACTVVDVIIFRLLPYFMHLARICDVALFVMKNVIFNCTVRNGRWALKLGNRRYLKYKSQTINKNSNYF
jgi:hypothetical protein